LRHINENGYIQFCNLCDGGHYLALSVMRDLPAEISV